MVVDFPAPLGPMKPVTAPAGAVKVTASTAMRRPYFLESRSTEIMPRFCCALAGCRIVLNGGPNGTFGRCFRGNTLAIVEFMRRHWHSLSYALIAILGAILFAGSEPLEMWIAAIYLAGLVLAIPAIIWRRRQPWGLVVSGAMTAFVGNPVILALAMFSFALRRKYWQVLMAGIVGVMAVAASVTPFIHVLQDGEVIHPDSPGYSSAKLTADLYMIALAIIVPAFIGAFIATRRALEAQLRTQLHAAETEREMRSHTAVLAERSRIAEEMHDSLGHQLVLISTQAGGLELNATKGPEFVESHSKIIAETSRKALAELRAVVEALSDPELATMPGLDEIPALVARANAAGATVSYQPTEHPKLAFAVSTLLYRIAQEGITNAMRHAPGAAITLTVETTDEGVCLQISNPVTGPRTSSRNGTGLARLRDRTRRLGGTFVREVTDTSFTITVTLPLEIK